MLASKSNLIIFASSNTKKLYITLVPSCDWWQMICRLAQMDRMCCTASRLHLREAAVGLHVLSLPLIAACICTCSRPAHGWQEQVCWAAGHYSDRLLWQVDCVIEQKNYGSKKWGVLVHVMWLLIDGWPWFIYLLGFSDRARGCY